MLKALSIAVLLAAPVNLFATDPIGDPSLKMAVKAQARQAEAALRTIFEKSVTGDPAQRPDISVTTQEASRLIDETLKKIADQASNDTGASSKQVKGILSQMNKEIQKIEKGCGDDSHPQFHFVHALSVKMRALRALADLE